MSELITAELVDLDLSAETKDAAARSLAERMVASGRVTDLEGFLADVAAREAQMPTGLDGGIGIPHCRSEHVTAPTLAFGRSRRGHRLRCAGRPGGPDLPDRGPRGRRRGSPVDPLDPRPPPDGRGLHRRPPLGVTDPAEAAALIRGEEPEAETGKAVPETGRGRSGVQADAPNAGRTETRRRDRCRPDLGPGREPAPSAGIRPGPIRRPPPPRPSSHPRLPHRRRHLLPHRHRAHLHGRRVAGEGR